jgi:hypothetical protein
MDKQSLANAIFDRNYGGVIWTNHSLEKLAERGIDQGDAWYTWKKPHQSRYAKTQGAWIYYRAYKDQKIEVVAKMNEIGKWVILSVWNRPLRTEKEKIPKKPNFLISLIHSLLKRKKKNISIKHGF